MIPLEIMEEMLLGDINGVKNALSLSLSDMSDCQIVVLLPDA